MATITKHGGETTSVTLELSVHEAAVLAQLVGRTHGNGKNSNHLSGLYLKLMRVDAVRDYQPGAMMTGNIRVTDGNPVRAFPAGSTWSVTGAF